jgi:hypothetical protein
MLFTPRRRIFLPSSLLSKNTNDENIYKCIFSCCFVWVWNLVTLLKLNVNVKGRVWGHFGTAACRPIVPLPQWVPLTHLQRRHAPWARETSDSEGGNYTRNFASTFVIQGGTRFFYMPQSWDMGQILSLPLRRKACGGFFRCPKNPTTSAGFEPANSGTRGQHANR